MNMVFQRKPLSEETFYKLSDLVVKHMGIKMPITKKALLESRLQKLIKLNDITTYEEYYELIAAKKANDPAIVQFCNAVATNKTYFFRESGHFDFLEATVLPELISRGIKKIRVWSTASSTGEEPYTLAMVLSEFAQKHNGVDFSVLGTDISTKVLTKAKAGVYSADEIDGIAPGLQRKYLKSVGDNFTIVPSLKNKMRWGRFNLMSRRYDVPGPFEIVFCRNVLIYFNRENQASIYNKMVGQIIPKGFLFLGHSESMAGMHARGKSVAPAVFQID